MHPDGSQYIAYVRADADERLGVAQRVGGSWQAVPTTGLPDGAVSALTLRADLNGVLYLACNIQLSASEDTTSKVFKFEWGTWEELPALRFDAETPLQLNPADGTPHVMGYNAANNTCLMALPRGSLEWQPVGQCSFNTAPSPQGIGFTAAGGAPLVAYYDAQDGASYVVQLVSGSWERLGGMLAAGDSREPQLVTAPDGSLVAGYRDGQGAPVVKVFEGAGWTTISTQDLPATVYSLRLAITVNGVLLAGYSYSGDNGWKPGAMQYSQL